MSHLVMFAEVAKLGSLRLASEKLHRTAPAVSQGIRQLETSLSLDLFSRGGYRLELTSAGKVLLPYVIRTLDAANTMQEVASRLAMGNETSVSLAIEASFDINLVLPVLEQVQSQFPATQIILKQEYVSGAVQSVQNRESSFCISAMDLSSEFDPGLNFHFLAVGTLLDVVSPTLLARHPNLQSARDLLDEYQIIVQDSGLATQGRDLGVQDGQRRWYVNDFGTKMMLIQRGMGWGKIPQHQAESSLRDGSLVPLKLPDYNTKVELRFCVIKNNDTVLGPVAQALWQQLKSYFNAND